MDEDFEKFKQSIVNLGCSLIKCSECPYRTRVGENCELVKFKEKIQDFEPKDERTEAIKLLSGLINTQPEKDELHKALSVLEEGSRK